MNLKLDDLNVYKENMSVSQEVWDIVEGWNWFAKDTVGKQLMRSADSISANLAEGYGRYFYKENRQFCFYSRGSLCETKSWIVKAEARKLIGTEKAKGLREKLDLIHRLLNGYLNSIGKFPLKPNRN